MNVILATTVTTADLSTLLETPLNRRLEALNPDGRARWAPPPPIDEPRPPPVTPAVTEIAGPALSRGMEAPGPLVTADWQQQFPARPELKPMAGTMLRLDIRASFIVPRFAGGMARVAFQPRQATPAAVVRAAAEVDVGRAQTHDNDPNTFHRI
ncbi:MAG: hypothetical protein AB1801_27450 [Chloroflexota bacterium]